MTGLMSVSGYETICSKLFIQSSVYRDGESEALNVSRLDKGKAGQDVSEHGCEAWTRKNSEDSTSKVGGRILLTRAEDVESEYQRNKLGHFRGDVVAIQKEFLGAQIWPQLGLQHLNSST